MAIAQRHLATGNVTVHVAPNASISIRRAIDQRTRGQAEYNGVNVQQDQERAFTFYHWSAPESIFCQVQNLGLLIHES